jgi:hypothetical protein
MNKDNVHSMKLVNTKAIGYVEIVWSAINYLICKLGFKPKGYPVHCMKPSLQAWTNSAYLSEQILQLALSRNLEYKIGNNQCWTSV